jgi:hypothetical protein
MSDRDFYAKWEFLVSLVSIQLKKLVSLYKSKSLILMFNKQFFFFFSVLFPISLITLYGYENNHGYDDSEYLEESDTKKLTNANEKIKEEDVKKKLDEYENELKRNKQEEFVVDLELNVEVLNKKTLEDYHSKFIEIHSSLIKSLIQTYQRIGFLFGEILDFINKNALPELIQLNQIVEHILPEKLDFHSPLKTLIGEIIPTQQKNKHTILSLLLQCIRIFPSHSFFEILQALSKQNLSIVKSMADVIYSGIIPVVVPPIAVGSNPFELDAVSRLLVPVDLFSDGSDSSTLSLYVKSPPDYKGKVVTTQQIKLVGCPDIDDIRKLFSSFAEGLVFPTLGLLLPVQSSVIEGRVAQQSIDVLIDIISRNGLERYLFIWIPQFNFLQWW